MTTKRYVAIHLAALICVGTAAGSAYAHHSHAYFYDQCQSITVEGLVESVQWKNPHSLIVLRLDDGTAYTVDWSGLSGLTNQGLIGAAEAALVFGARIAVTGNPIRSAAQIREHVPAFNNEVNPRTVDPTLIRSVAGDGWRWAAQNPPDCKGN
jgi:hypothetical protein